MTTPEHPQPRPRDEHAPGSLARDAELLEERLVPGWLRPHLGENRLPVMAAILVAVALQWALPDRFGLRPRWVIPTLELVLLALLTGLNPLRMNRASTLGKYASFALVAAITLDNTASAVLLDRDIISGLITGDATGLLASGAAIYLTNIIAFGIWYWELDRGGPFARHEGRNPYPDFLFPQMTNPDLAPAHWTPRFLDYVYTSFTNVLAFSPTDTMPLSRWAKTLMAVQSMVAVSTTALVVARAVNILK